MTNFKKSINFAFLLAFFASGFSYAGIIPGSYNVNLVSGHKVSQDFWVRNSSDSDVVVTTRLYKIASDYSERKEVYSLQDSAISYTPSQFAIPANSSKKITIKLSDQIKNREQAYQLELLPLNKKYVAEAISYDNYGKPTQLADLGLLMAQKINIHAAPSNVSTNINISYVGDSIKITNDGTVSAFLDNLRICKNGVCNNNTSFNKARLYPSRSITINDIEEGAEIMLSKESMNYNGDNDSTTITLNSIKKEKR
jgi:P pilus assembly chaperone PapD